MPSIRPAVREALEAAIEAGVHPHKPKGSLDVWLRAPDRRVKLAKTDGTLTPAGAAYRALDRASPLPEPFDTTKDPIRKKNSHYVRDGDRDILVRRGDVITKKGKYYYSKRSPTAYLVTVPGIHRNKGHRTQGVPFGVPSNTFMPENFIYLPADTPPPMWTTSFVRGSWPL